MKNLKTIALHRIAFELLTEFKKWDGCKDFDKEVKQIESHLFNLNKKHSKEYRELMQKNPHTLIYIKEILLHFTRILSFTTKLPNKEQVEKIIKGSLVSETDSVKMLTGVLEETQGIEHLLSIKPVKERYVGFEDMYLELLENYHLDQYVLLTNIIAALELPLEGKKSKKDMSFIINYGEHTICNLCGFFESWKVRPMKTIRFLNKQLKNERVYNLPKEKKEIRVFAQKQRSMPTLLQARA